MTTVQGVWNSKGPIRRNDSALTLCASLIWNGGPALVIGKVRLNAGVIPTGDGVRAHVALTWGRQRNVIDWVNAFFGQGTAREVIELYADGYDVDADDVRIVAISCDSLSGAPDLNLSNLSDLSARPPGLSSHHKRRSRSGPGQKGRKVTKRRK